MNDLYKVLCMVGFMGATFLGGCGSPSSFDSHTNVFVNNNQEMRVEDLNASAIEKELRTRLGDELVSLTFSKDLEYAFTVEKNQENGHNLELYHIYDNTIEHQKTIRSFEEFTVILKVLVLSNSKIIYLVYDQDAPEGSDHLAFIYDYLKDEYTNYTVLKHIYDWSDAYVSEDGKYIYFYNHDYFIDVSHPYSMILESY